GVGPVADELRDRVRQREGTAAGDVRAGIDGVAKRVAVAVGKVGVGGAGRRDAVACLGHVAGTHRRAADRPRVPGRMLARRTAAAADITGTDLAVVGAGLGRGEYVLGTGSTLARARLRDVALA